MLSHEMLIEWTPVPWGVMFVTTGRASSENTKVGILSFVLLLTWATRYMTLTRVCPQGVFFGF